MAKRANVITQNQITAACKGAFAAGAKQATVETKLVLPDGTTKVVKVTASAEESAHGPLKANGNGEEPEGLESLI
jgi:hypothetical protein